MSIVKSTLTLNSTASHPIGTLNYSRSSSATRINSIGQVEEVAANKIRQDYFSDPANTGRLRGWLLEEASTNTCLQSADFGTTWITSTATQTNAGSITTNTVKSPDGATTADTLQSNSGTTGIIAARQQGFTFTNGTTYTVSVWAKKKDLDYLEITNKDDALAGRTYSKVFKISDGTLGASGGTVGAAKIDSYVNGWYRCSVTFTAAANTSSEVYFKARNNDANNTTYTFNNNEGIYLWGAQVEAIAYPTSYIPTTTTAVTRNADVAYIEDTENMWNWDVGTSIWIDATPLSTTSTQPIYHYQDATNDNYFTLLSDGKCKLFANGNNQLSANPFTTGFTTTYCSDFRNVMAVKSNRFHMAHNGSLSEQLPDTSIMVPLNSSSSKYTIKFFHGTGLSSGSGWLGNFRIYSNVLSDIELQNVSFRKNDDAQELALNAVQVVDQSISTQKIAPAAIVTSKIADDAITNAKILNATIETAQLGDDQVTTAKIAAGAVTGTEIANNAITSAHLGVDIILAEDIAANAVTVSELANNAVSTVKILDNAVTGAKIALGSDAAGDIMYYSGTDYVRLAKGTDGQVLTLASGVPRWAADSTDVAGSAVGGDVNGTVANIQINANAVGSAEIAANAVTASEIATNAVGIAELNVTDGAAGQLLSTNGSGVLSFISDPTNVGATAVGGDLSGSVSNAQLVANCVTGTELANSAVTASHLANGAVSLASITDGTLTGTKFVNDTITGDKIADHASNDANRAIGTNHLKNDCITGDKISDDAINSEHYTDGSIDTAHIGDLQVTGGKIANATITGTQLAGTSVGNSHLTANAVTTSKVADDQITIAKLAVTDGSAGQYLTTDGNGTLSFSTDSTNVSGTAVGGDLTGTVGNAQIAANAVGSNEIANNAVGTTEIADGSITNAKLGANSITSDKISLDIIVAEDLANNSVTAAELSDNAVRTAKIMDDNVTTAKIADNAITGAKIALGSDAAGDVMYYDGTNYVRLAKGTDGEVLTLASGVPSWAADSTNVSGTSLGGVLGGTVGNATIDANAINGTHLALGSDAQGDIMYYDGTNYVRLAKGTAGHVLTMNGGATAPSWAADSTNVGATAVGGNVSGTVSNITISAGVVTPTMLSASGTANNTTFLRGDGAWAVPTVTETDPTAVTMAIALG